LIYEGKAGQKPVGKRCFTRNDSHNMIVPPGCTSLKKPEHVKRTARSGMVLWIEPQIFVLFAAPEQFLQTFPQFRTMHAHYCSSHNTYFLRHDYSRGAERGFISLRTEA
jgi:hypothetical protein